jgi:hypothetical protein
MIRNAPGRLAGGIALFGILATFCPGARAQDSSATQPQQAAGTLSTKEFEELKAQLAAQQKQIEQLRLALEDQKKQLDRTQAEKAQPVENASKFSLPATQKLGEVASTAPMIPPVSGLSPSGVSAQTGGSGAEEVAPLFFRIGTAKFTPLGFVDVTSVFRSKNTASGIGSSFGGVPFGNSVTGNQTENRFSLQNSRIGFRIDSHVLGGDAIGYLETDFLGNAPNGLLTTSNSNTLRLRLFWFDWRRDKFEFLGGQTWSLLTPNRKGLSALPGDLFYSQDIDTNYQAGLSWTRAAEVRFIYHANDHVTAGVALENPEQYVGGGVTFPASLSSALGGQFGNGSSPNNSPNLHPDIIGKVAFDGTAGGRAMHFEVGGVYRTFQDFIPASTATPTAYSGQKNYASGGGGEANGVFEVAKNFRLIATSFFGTGIGRYIQGLAPDLVVKPNGQISTVNTASGIGGFEYSFKPKDNPTNRETLIYSYYGGVYVDRNYFADAAGKLSGYGFSGSAGSNNRSIQEATIGLTQTLWKNPTYGDLKLMTQYSYLTRNPWYVATGAPGHADLHMVFVNLRYDIP